MDIILRTLSNYEFSDSEKEEVFSCKNKNQDLLSRTNDSACSADNLTIKAK